MAKVSIIIPVFEVEDMIEECLDSVVKQTFYDVEIICINDGTMDNSVSLIKEFQARDPRIEIFHHESNRGLSASRNTGLKHAKGEYIKFVDSDDTIALNAVETLVCTIERTNADWAFSAFNVIDVEGKIQLSRSPFHTEEMEQIAKAGLIEFDGLPERLNQMWPSAWHSLWRLSKIQQSGATFPEGFYFEDHEFFFAHGFDVSTAAYVPEPLYNYRTGRSGQITTEVSSKIFDIFGVLERLAAILRVRLTGDQFFPFYARLSIRLLVERIWALPSTGKLVEAYETKACDFLSQFEDALILSSKDWYIRDEDLERIWKMRGFERGTVNR